MAKERRIKLHNELLKFCDNVYFQPSESVKLKYPCIIYRKKAINSVYADNASYIYRPAFNCTLIERDPDSDLLEQMGREFEYFRIDTCFAIDNLYHSNFTIYY